MMRVWGKISRVLHRPQRLRRNAPGPIVLVTLAVFGLGCSDGDPGKSSPGSSRASAPSPAPPPPAAPSPTAPSPAAPRPKTEPVETPPADGDAVARGRAVYVANCSACHNVDPALPGTLGPEVAGSSLELLEARLLRNTYPKGYTPKRDSRVMMALPYLKDDIGPLAAYLQQ